MKNPRSSIRLPETTRALHVYDAEMAALNRCFGRGERAKSDDDAYVLEMAEKAALMKLQDAFFRDTCDRNSLDHCRAVTASLIRKWVRSAKSSEQKP